MPVRPVSARIQTMALDLRRQTIGALFDVIDEEMLGLSAAQRRDKYSQMSENVFRFYRGSACLFYYDATRFPTPYHTPERLPTWLQGDLHFENFGAFQDRKGNIVYDVNDFDEGYLGSYLYDLMRMTVSIVLVGQTGQLKEKEIAQAVQRYLEAYAADIDDYGRGKKSPHSVTFDASDSEGPIKKLLKKLEKQDERKLLMRITTVADGTHRFLSSEEITPASDGLRKDLMSLWPDYIDSIDTVVREKPDFYRIEDVAVKSGSGTASIGLPRYYILVEGDAGCHHDDLILEAKAVRTPIPACFLPYQESFFRWFDHQGKRVVTTQKAMQHRADPYLGYLTINGEDFYVRERCPFKKKLKAETVADGDELAETVALMGRITAKIHARADADVERLLLPHHSEEAIAEAIDRDAGGFLLQITEWALEYARRVHADYDLFRELLSRWPAEG
ncbi:DUF2252 domain-containing protein [Heliobacterium gestii]|uniref:DUF2252 domain-containing protein n=1 Tax=Heliomicrobium gestii TaxID=2699 RepID=A0A845L930_HELGE|nr:DUF2252 family protein [Heliomicrobium gestii]MBM7865492.1 uncharacterized protein (DUF2252 family) [Heliomicrobium gestii]MZP41744.1 DUF2252 domain-containing protein [Heliomicrobium gestii]